VRVWGCEWW